MQSNKCFEEIKRAFQKPCDRQAISGIMPDLGHASPCNIGGLVSSDSLVLSRL